MKCAFCFGEANTTKLSKEHLFSVPICRAFGIDRSMAVGSFDANSGELGLVAPLDERQVKLPCTTCNSGWMGQLENDTARTLQYWMTKPEARLSTIGLAHVTRWLAKTAFVVGFSELGARKFMTNDRESVIPDYTLARSLYRGDTLNVVVGAARVNRCNTLWGAGNASLEPKGPTRISSRAVNVLALNLGELQLWSLFQLLNPTNFGCHRASRDSIRIQNGGR